MRNIPSLLSKNNEIYRLKTLNSDEKVYYFHSPYFKRMDYFGKQT